MLWNILCFNFKHIICKFIDRVEFVQFRQLEWVTRFKNAVEIVWNYKLTNSVYKQDTYKFRAISKNLSDAENSTFPLNLCKNKK